MLSPFDVALGPPSAAVSNLASLTFAEHRPGSLPGPGAAGRMGFGSGSSLGAVPLAALPGQRSLDCVSESAGSAGRSGTEEADELVGVAQPNVAAHQRLYVRYSSLSEAHALSEWRASDSLAAEAAAFGEAAASTSSSDAGQLAVSLAITTAPAAFGLPMVQRKAFKPPFSVRVEVRARGPLALAVTLEAHALNEAAHAQAPQWLPEAASAEVAAPAEGEEEAVGTETVDFVELKWAKSSRMAKRWIAFSCKVKDDVLFAVYELPTVVISRRTDQYAKAHETLFGAPPGIATKRPRPALSTPAGLHGPGFAPGCAGSLPPPGRPRSRPQAASPLRDVIEETPPRPRLAHALSAPPDGPGTQGEREDDGAPAVVDAGYVRLWICHRYQAMGFARQLHQADVQALERQAGIPGNPPGGLPPGGFGAPVDPGAWASFRHWFGATLRTLAVCERAWNAARPHWVCGFAIDRRTAEGLLADQPPGAFLVRVSAEPGALAISANALDSSGAPYAEHVLVDGVDLAGRCLEAWVWGHPRATHLLDPMSGRLLPKEHVFLSLRRGGSGPLRGGLGTLGASGGALAPRAAPAPVQKTWSGVPMNQLMTLANMDPYAQNRHSVLGRELNPLRAPTPEPTPRSAAGVPADDGLWNMLLSGQGSGPDNGAFHGGPPPLAYLGPPHGPPPGPHSAPLGGGEASPAADGGDLSPFSGEIARMHGDFLPRSGPEDGVADLDLPLLGSFTWDAAGCAVADFPMTPDWARAEAFRASGGGLGGGPIPSPSPFALEGAGDFGALP